MMIKLLAFMLALVSVNTAITGSDYLKKTFKANSLNPK